MATARTMSDLAATTFLRHDDIFHVGRPSETAVADQDKKITVEAFDTARNWTQVSTSAYTAAPANYYGTPATGNTVPAWLADTAVSTNEVWRPTVANGYFYEAVVVAGDTKTHATTEPVWPTTLGECVVDDQVTWMCRGANGIATSEDMTGVIYAGVPLKYVYNSTTYYGVCIGSTASYISLAGAPLNTLQSLTALYYGRAERVAMIALGKGGDYDAGVADVAPDVEHYWMGGNAYLVFFAMKHKTNAGGAATNPYVNLENSGSVLSTTGDGSAADMGIQLATSWQYNSPTAIKVANYALVFNSTLTPTVTVTGSDPDATGLSVQALAVLE